MLKNLWFYNEIISVVALTWFLAQLIKFTILLVKNKKIKFSEFKAFISTGGMPSAHTAVVSSLALSVGILAGFNSVVFAISFIFTVIVIYDAVGVRRASGDHARALNKLVPRVLKDDSKHFKTRIGHKPVEVFAGVLLGLLVPLLTMWSQLSLPEKWKQTLSYSYLFNVNPGSSFHYYGLFIFKFGAFLLIGIILTIISARTANLIYKKLYSKIYTFLLTIGAAGFLLLFFRYESVYFLSGRFLLIALFIASIIWVVIIAYYGFRKFPSELSTYNDYLRKEKYFPKQKKH